MTGRHHSLASFALPCCPSRSSSTNTVHRSGNEAATTQHDFVDEIRKHSTQIVPHGKSSSTASPASVANPSHQAKEKIMTSVRHEVKSNRHGSPLVLSFFMVPRHVRGCAIHGNSLFRIRSSVLHGPGYLDNIQSLDSCLR